MDMKWDASPSRPYHIQDHDRPSPKRPSQGVRSNAWQTSDTTPVAMAIPGMRTGPEAPPPLPPPRYLHGLTAGGDDPGWSFKNPQRGGFGRSQQTSVVPSNLPQAWRSSRDERMPPDQLEARRRQSSSSTARSTTDSERRPDYRMDEGYYSLSGVTELHGERHLHHRGQERSSHAYDNKLLSKIGKPKTPPGTHGLNSAESSPTSTLTFGRQPVPSQLRSLSFPNSSASNYADSPTIKREPQSGRFGDNCLSRPISPRTIPSEYSSSSVDNSRRSSAMSSDVHSVYSQHPSSRLPSISDATGTTRPSKARRSLGGPGSALSDVLESAPVLHSPNPRNKTHTLHPLNITSITGITNPPSSRPHTSHTSESAPDTASPRTVKRESHDSSIFSFTDPEATTLEQLHLEDSFTQHTSSHARFPTAAHHRELAYRHPPPPRPLHASASMSGLKRKQMASPPDPSQDAAHAHLQAQLLQHTANSAASHLAASQFQPQHSSISSQSSVGFPNGSYASSAGPSMGGSSYTSIDAHSPSGISPSDPTHQYPSHLAAGAEFNPALSLDPTIHGARPATYSDHTHDGTAFDMQVTPPRKTNENPAHRSNQPELPANSHICRCCPKKPKKFDSAEELRQHENEKQHRCQYCNNRFKNKNEAERHQNSLHLRRQSWSCGALAANYNVAFFPKNEILPPASNANDPTPAKPESIDLCGYCGAEFTNEPPDWEERTKHLDQVHKFRECNQKKFFRADHFRQHLRHSHAGPSGKWTNKLESACLLVENPMPGGDGGAPGTPTQSAPVANMSNAPNGQIVKHEAASGPVSSPGPGQLHMSPPHHPAGEHPSQAGMGPVELTNIDPNIASQMGNPGMVAGSGVMGPSQ